MKVLLTTEYFTPFAPGGTTLSIQFMALRLQQAGHNVAVFTPNYGADSREIVNGIQVVRYPFWLRLPKGHQTAKVWVHANPFFQLYSAWRLSKTVRQWRPDVIHVQEKYSYPFSWLVARMNRIPVFLTVRDGGFLCPITTCLMTQDAVPADCGFVKLHRECSEFFNDHYIRRRSFLGKWKLKLVLHYLFLEIRLRRLLVSSAQGIFGVSRATLDLLRPVIDLPAHQAVLYNPPPETEEIITDDTPVHGYQGRPSILFVGKRSLGKGFPTLIEAATRLKDTHPRAVFLVAGEKALEDWGKLPDNIVLLGQLSRAQLAAAYDACAMVVFPALWPDTFSRVPLEAAFAGKPCIGSRKGGTPEAIVDGQTGVLFPPGNAAALAQAIADLLDHPYKAKKMGDEAKRLLPLRFPADRYLSTLLGAYQTSRSRVAGVLPSLGGILDMKQAGQHERLLNYDLHYYAQHYDRVYYFSYLRERLEDYTQDPLLREKVTLIPRPAWVSRRLYAFLMPWIQAETIRRCGILRAYQLTGVIPAVLAKWFYGIPFVTTYGYDYAGFERLEGRPWKAGIYELLARWALPRADGILVTTAEIRKALAARYPKASFCLTPNGVDTAQFSPNGNEHQIQTFDLLFVGRLEPQKNLDRFMEALAKVRTEHPVRLSLVGKGSLRASLEAKARVLGLQTVFEGVLNHDDLPKRMRAADLFVLPSLIEGHPKALLEAMACGLPCAVSSGAGCEEMVRQSDGGITFDPGSVESMTTVIEQALGKEAFRKQWGNNARQWALEHFDIGRLMKQEIEFLDRCMPMQP